MGTPAILFLAGLRTRFFLGLAIAGAFAFSWFADVIADTSNTSATATTTASPNVTSLAFIKQPPSSYCGRAVERRPAIIGMRAIEMIEHHRLPVTVHVKFIIAADL